MTTGHLEGKEAAQGQTVVTGRTLEEVSGNSCYLCAVRPGEHRIALKGEATVLVGEVKLHTVRRQDNGMSITFMLCDACRLLVDKPSIPTAN